MSKDFRMFTNVICITGEDKNPCGGTKVKIHWAIQKFDFLRARSWTGGRGNLFFPMGWGRAERPASMICFFMMPSVGLYS